VTAREDIATVAGQLAELTRTVEEMASQLAAVRKRADSQQERADTQHERTEIQQERIDLAARELTEVSDRLQAAANAERPSREGLTEANSGLERRRLASRPLSPHNSASGLGSDRSLNRPAQMS
jgi:molecular chaperone GrpE (heat shock protein)